MRKIINPESVAEELIKDLGITIPFTPTTICKNISSNSFAIEYIEQQFHSEKICGLSVGDNSRVKIIINSKIQPTARRLFTAAHEIGHAILHIQAGITIKSRCFSEDIKNNTQKNIEIEANRFASALLMPRHLISEKIHSNDLTWVLIKNLSQHYNTSLEATTRRVINISKDMCALIIEENNNMWTPVKSNSFPCFIPISNSPKYLQATDYNNGNEIPDKLEECDLSDWNLKLNSKQYRCYYSTLNFESYCKKMTLLLLEEVEEEEQEWDNPKF